MELQKKYDQIQAGSRTDLADTGIKLDFNSLDYRLKVSLSRIFTFRKWEQRCDKPVSVSITRVYFG